MHLSRIFTLSLLTGLSIWAARAEAGWVIDQVVSTDPTHGRHQVVLQANRLKTLLSAADGTPTFAFILDLNTETITQVDYREHRYMTATVAEYVHTFEQAQQEASERAAEEMRQMEEQIREMPADQRAVMERMMRAQREQAIPSRQDCSEPRLEFRKTREEATIAGYRAVRYDVLADGKPESEVWTARGLTAWTEIDRHKLEQVMTAMATVTPRCAPGQRRQRLPGNDPAWRLATEGYAVRTVDRTGTPTTVEVVRAEKRTVRDAEFQAPAGFARRTLREMLGR